MPTTKQKRAVANMVENGGNVSKAMRDAGYSPATAKTPKKLTATRGFNDLLAEYGLTEELVTTSLVEDIKAKPRRRFWELSLAAEILSMKKREPVAPDKPQPILGVMVNVQINNGHTKNSGAVEA